MTPPDLLAFANAVASGTIRVIDLTQTLSPEFPTIVLPPELGQCAPFRTTVALPASGVKVIEFQVIPQSAVPGSPTIRVDGDGASARIRVAASG